MATDQLVCLWGAPSPVYKGGEEEEGWPQGVRPKGGFLLLVGRFPPFLVQAGEEGRRGRGEKESGATPPSPCPVRIAHGGGAPPLVGSPLSPLWPMLAHYFPWGFR